MGPSFVVRTSESPPGVTKTTRQRCAAVLKIARVIDSAKHYESVIVLHRTRRTLHFIMKTLIMFSTKIGLKIMTDLVCLSEL